MPPPQKPENASAASEPPAGDRLDARSRRDLLRLIEQNYLAEQEDAALYRQMAAQETDPHRRELLERLAASEDRHAARWAEKLRQFAGPGAQPPQMGAASRWRLRLLGWMGNTAAIRRRETGEVSTTERYRQMEQRFGPEAGDILGEIEAEERSHARKLRTLAQTEGPAHALSFAMGREHWHRHEHTWLSDAIYGANDGLGAVFGIVAGVAGYTQTSRYVLVSGIAGMIASALSMGAGAYLAAKSDRELYDAEIHREAREIAESPAEEREELQLFYQLKGFSEAEATTEVPCHTDEAGRIIHGTKIGRSQSARIDANAHLRRRADRFETAAQKRHRRRPDEHRNIDDRVNRRIAAGWRSFEISPGVDEKEALRQRRGQLQTSRPAVRIDGFRRNPRSEAERRPGDQRRCNRCLRRITCHVISC